MKLIKIRKIVMIAILAVCCISLSSCGGGLENNIVGTWQEIKTVHVQAENNIVGRNDVVVDTVQQIFEFRNDGTYSHYISGNKLALELFANRTPSQTGKYSINTGEKGDVLALIPENFFANEDYYNFYFGLVDSFGGFGLDDYYDEDSFELEYKNYFELDNDGSVKINYDIRINNDRLYLKFGNNGKELVLDKIPKE